jgi:DNA polymerase
MEGFEGCALKFTARHLVFLDGLPQADVVFIGEAPGRDEDREGRPFVGRSGKLLDAMVQAMGLERGKQAAITNLLPWRPPGNRTPSRQELLICRPFLDRQIDLVQPRLIVALGGAAAGELSGLQEGIKSLRKRELSVTTETATYPMLATFHPAYLLRQPAAKAEAWRDCLNVMDKLKSLAAGESAV